MEHFFGDVKILQYFLTSTHFYLTIKKYPKLWGPFKSKVWNPKQIFEMFKKTVYTALLFKEGCLKAKYIEHSPIRALIIMCWDSEWWTWRKSEFRICNKHLSFFCWNICSCWVERLCQEWKYLGLFVCVVVI